MLLFLLSILYKWSHRHVTVMKTILFFFAIHYKNWPTIHAALLRSKNSKCQHTNLIDITFLHCENTKDIQPMDKYTIISQLVLMPYIGEFTL